MCIDPFTGIFTFVSPGFSGNASDRFTVEHSGFLDKLKTGQRILADRGFTARDLLAKNFQRLHKVCHLPTILVEWK